MLDSMVLFAEGGDGMWLIILFPALLILMWFLMVAPQKRQETRMREMLAALEKNDRVMTVGGLIGTVHVIDRDQNEIVLKVDEANNTKVRFHLTAVSAVFPKDKT
ncbi:MAG: preprotein translocase subunit YajC [Planctomycetaceae bacterium]|nr:preprotein translocase subunit YajC [Planctomycetaceae bacterium]